MIQTDESSIQHQGNASTTVPYPVPFKFQHDEDIVVVVRDANGAETTQILNTNYTVVGAGNDNGGSVTMSTAVPSTSTVSIFRDIEATQLTSYEEGDAFPAKSHERALDKLTMLVQQALRGGGGQDGLAFRLTEASGGLNPVARMNDTMLGIDASGKAILRPASDMLGWLGQVGTVWQNDAERLNTRGAFAGQLGIQLDNLTLYVATSTEPGAWSTYLPGTGIVVATQGTPSTIAQPDGDLVGTTEAQILANKTLNAPTINNPSGMVPEDVGLDQIDNTPDSAKPVSTQQQAALDLKQDLDEKGIAGGYASLDGGGQVPLTQLPIGVTGALVYKGTWNASTNSPAIPTAAAGNAGWYYVVSVAGTTNINGISSWAVGDEILSNGSVWQKLTSTAAVNSVAGKTGVVTLVPGDVGLGSVDNTSDVAKNSATGTLTNKTIDGASNTLTVRLGSDVTGNLPTSRLNNGTGAATNTWWCGDGTWKQPPGTGDVGGPLSSVDGDVVLFQGVTGKIVKGSGKPGADLVTGPSTSVDGRPAVFNGTSGKAIRMSTSVFMPVGSVLDYAGLTEPPGWLFCDGREILQANYPALYAAIGEQYGGESPASFIREAHTSATTGSSLTLSNLVSSGTDRLLLVWALAHVTGDVDITGITFNGVALTRQLQWALHTGTGIGDFSLYALVNPPAVTGNVVMTLSKAATQLNMSAQIYNRVNQTTPLGTTVASPLTATNSPSISLEVPSGDNDLIIAALTFSLAGTYSTGQDEFAVTNFTAGALHGIRCSQRSAGAPPTTTVGWGRPSAPNSVMGVAIKPLAQGGFHLPDLRGYVAAGRDDMGGMLRGVLATVTTGKTTANSKTISQLGTTAGFHRNMRVYGDGIPDGALIATVASATSVTLTVDATASGTGVTLRFGMVDAVTMGARGGSRSWPLNVAEMPAHQHTFTLPTSAGPGYAAGTGYTWTTAAAWTDVAGGNDYHNNLQPTFILNKIICTGT